MQKRKAVASSKLDDLKHLVLVQNSVISHAMQMRDNDAMYNRAKINLETSIANDQRKLDYLLDTRKNANSTITAAEIRRSDLQLLIRKEKHRLKIERYEKLQKQLLSLESDMLK